MGGNIKERDEIIEKVSLMPYKMIHETQKNEKSNKENLNMQMKKMSTKISE